MAICLIRQHAYELFDAAATGQVELLKLQDEVVALRSQLHDSVQCHLDASIELQDLRDSLVAVRDLLSQRDAELAALEVQHLLLQQHNAVLQEQLREAGARGSAAEVARAAAAFSHRRCTILEGELAQLRQDAALRAADHAKMFAKMKDRCSDLRQTRLHLKRKQSAIVALTADNVALTADNGRLTADNGRLTADNGRLTADNGRLTADNGRLIADNGRLNAKVSRLEQLASEFAMAKEETAAEHAAQIFRLKNCAKKTKSVTKKMARASKADAADTRRAIADALEQIEVLREQLKAVNAERDCLEDLIFRADPDFDNGDSITAKVRLLEAGDSRMYNQQCYAIVRSLLLCGLAQRQVLPAMSAMFTTVGIQLDKLPSLAVVRNASLQVKVLVGGQAYSRLHEAAKRGNTAVNCMHMDASQKGGLSAFSTAATSRFFNEDGEVVLKKLPCLSCRPPTAAHKQRRKRCEMCLS